jgi:DNA-binding winged helix-turn-helix (wHTH) protein
MANSDQPLGYRFGSFVLDLEWGGLLAANGKEIPLRPKSFALLRLLVENAGRIISHEAIMTALWPGLFVIENNVTQCIHDVRRALGSEASQILQTLPRRGYRFIADVVALIPGDHPPRTIVIRDCGEHGPASMDAAMTREGRMQAPEYKPGQSPNRPLHAGAEGTSQEPSSITRAASEGVERRSSHLRLLQDDPESLSRDLARRPAAVAFHTGRPTPYDGAPARLRDIAHETDLSTALQGSIRGRLLSGSRVVASSVKTIG